MIPAKVIVILFPLLGLAANAARLIDTIPLPGVQGRIDHMAVDTLGQRLFVAALGNNTLEVMDLKQGKVLQSLTGLEEPQGVAYVQKSNRIFVACGGDGSVKIFDGTSYKLIKALDLRDDADNVRYDPGEDKIYVGYGSGGIALVDPDSGVVLSTIKLSAHPESFQLEKQGKRIFVNVPDANEVDVLDREKKSVLSKWPQGHLRSNFPMALDEKNHRLFAGFRSPATLRVLDTETGKNVSDIPIDGDIDDVFFDSATRTLLLSCGGGYLDIIRQNDPDHYERTDRIPTAKGARTSFLVPQSGKLYLAVPARGSQGAEIRIYEAEPKAK